jgi:hypothetical protein
MALSHRPYGEWLDHARNSHYLAVEVMCNTKSTGLGVLQRGIEGNYDDRPFVY